MQDEQHTLVEPPLPSDPNASSPGSSSHGTGGSDGSVGGSGGSDALSTPIDTLRVREIESTRLFARLARVVAVGVALSLLVIGGDRLAKQILAGFVLATLIATSWLVHLLRDPRGYTMRRALGVAYVCVLSCFAGAYCYGVFSPAAAILPFGLHFFSSAQDFRATLSVYATCALLYLALAVLVMSGLLVDRGLVTADALPLADKIAMVGMVELILFATFLNARETRQVTLSALERHDRVLLGLAQREALLKEAKQDLERALRNQGLGRFSETTIGSYRLGAVIGRGAVGEVYEARHKTTEELAAVKLLHPTALADGDLVKRFLREARIAASLRVPNVVRVLEIGGLEAELPYIAMERLAGEDLAEYLRRHRALSIKATLALVQQVGAGLAAAQSAGIVHRDLKPRNIFRAGDARRPVWKILDFGVSKLLGAEGTQTQDIVGTPGYMAPEQALGKEVTHRSDLFALGVIVYRAITGRPAFTGEHVAETLYQVVHGMPPAPSTLIRMHPDVDAVLAMAIAKSPEERFDSAAELAAALETAWRGKLDPALRERGERLMARHPWGKVALAE